MDITLERILSLIPKKPDGKYVHGAKRDFADSLGMARNLVTMWESGQSQSYKTKLHEIAAKYNVSVDWLMGNTDEKTPDAIKDTGLNKDYFNLTAENKAFIDAMIEKLLKSQSDD